MKHAESKGPISARVAVITRTKDRPVLLRRAIGSVLEQSFADWALVIVNDGGERDQIEQLVGELCAGRREKVLLVHNETSLGMEAASNVGIENSRSEFIAIHDDDDSWHPDFLSETVGFMDARADDHILGGVVTQATVVVERIEESGEVVTEQEYPFNARLRSVQMIRMAYENVFPPICLLFKRTALEAVGGFDHRLRVLGDWDFHLRLLCGFNLEVIPKPLAYYHNRPALKDGIYGNTVHAEVDKHMVFRTLIQNEMIREDLSVGRFGIGAFAGMVAAFKDEINHVLYKLGTLEGKIDDVERSVRSELAQLKQRGLQGSVTSAGRNIVLNGDFSRRHRIEDRVPDVHESFAPGWVISYEGGHTRLRLGREQVTEADPALGDTRHFLRWRNLYGGKESKFNYVGLVLPSALYFSGETVCISFVCRIDAPEEIHVCFRHLKNADEGYGNVPPKRTIRASSAWQRHHVSFDLITIEREKLEPGHHILVLFQLPKRESFVFDMTNVQMELGSEPTDFEAL